MTWAFLGACGIAAGNAIYSRRRMKQGKKGKTILDPVVVILFAVLISVGVYKTITPILSMIGWWFW